VHLFREEAVSSWVTAEKRAKKKAKEEGPAAGESRGERPPPRPRRGPRRRLRHNPAGFCSDRTVLGQSGASPQKRPSRPPRHFKNARWNVASLPLPGTAARSASDGQQGVCCLLTNTHNVACLSVGRARQPAARQARHHTQTDRQTHHLDPLSSSSSSSSSSYIVLAALLTNNSMRRPVHTGSQATGWERTARAARSRLPSFGREAAAACIGSATSKKEGIPSRHHHHLPTNILGPAAPAAPAAAACATRRASLPGRAAAASSRPRSGSSSHRGCMSGGARWACRCWPTRRRAATRRCRQVCMCVSVRACAPPKVLPAGLPAPSA